MDCFTVKSSLIFHAVEWDGSPTAKREIESIIGTKANDFEGVLCWIAEDGTERQVHKHDTVAAPGALHDSVMILSPGAAFLALHKIHRHADDPQAGRGYRQSEVIGRVHLGLSYYFDMDGQLRDVMTPSGQFVPREALDAFVMIAQNEICFDFDEAACAEANDRLERELSEYMDRDDHDEFMSEAI